jgi:sigma-B regulation protein RsbU (phosphoserine phosphatase)
MGNRKFKALFVDDEEDDFHVISGLMKSIPGSEISLYWEADFARALESLKKNNHDVCLLNIGQGERGGLELLRGAIRGGCKTPIILLAPPDAYALDLEAMKSGAADYLVKGTIDAALLERSIRYAVKRNNEQEALRESQREQQTAKEQLQKAMRSIDEELEMARAVQESLLPQDIAIVNGIDVSAAYLPCGRIGGDLYDIIKIDDHTSYFLMFDVVGHGVPAALISAMVKISFSKNIIRNVCPAEVMERVNKEIVNLFHEKRHITAFLAVYDSYTGRLSFTKGGHPSPLLYHPRENRLEYISNTGLPLGMFADIHYEVSTVGLQSGDCLVVYTDGLTECGNEHDVLFGRKRLEDVLLTLPEESSTDDILGALIKAQLSFCGNSPRRDDITIMILKIP